MSTLLEELSRKAISLNENCTSENVHEASVDDSVDDVTLSSLFIFCLIIIYRTNITNDLLIAIDDAKSNSNNSFINGIHKNSNEKQNSVAKYSFW